MRREGDKGEEVNSCFFFVGVVVLYWFVVVVVFVIVITLGQWLLE